MSTITLIGLGPGDPALLTRAAADLLMQAPTIFTPASAHPALAELPPGKVQLLHAPDQAALVVLLLEQAERNGSVYCALPGHPHDHALTTALPSAQVRIVPGVSLIDACCDALGSARRAAGLQVLTSADLHLDRWWQAAAQADHPPAPAWVEFQGTGSYVPPAVPYPLLPTRPALFYLGEGAQRDLPLLQALLLLRYPTTHPLRLVHLDASGKAMRVWETPIEQLNTDSAARVATAIAVPPLEPENDQRSLEGLNRVAVRLLGPNGCPWDREQTHQSLRAGLLEEAHEVLEALDSGDMPALVEELGDLLFQVVVHSEMARQAGHFTLADVVAQITAKLIRRHPHVFGELTVDGTGTVLRNWEQIKSQELAAKGRARPSVLDGVPAGLPALATAQTLIKKAGRVGFAWSKCEDVWAKLREELEELAQASQENDSRQIAEEFGDVLFVLANLGRWLGLDAESTLREANSKFRRRFRYVEQAAQRLGRDLSSMTLTEMQIFWQEAKQQA